MLKILIVEDDVLSVQLLEKQLEKFEFFAHRAENGSDAVEMFIKEFCSKVPYDLIFMDIMMPGSDGMEALVKIRKFEEQNFVSPKNEAKIIMTTALDDQKVILKAIMRGRIFGYLTKPIDPKKLFELLQKCIKEKCVAKIT